MKWEPPKLPAEEFMLPVQKFNDAVGPLFAEFKGRFPLVKHTEHGLQHSLGIFLTAVYNSAIEQMQKLQPERLTREQWLVAPPELKADHLRWQSNLRYLKQRNTYFLSLIIPHREI
jgi:hypothetical protein